MGSLKRVQFNFQLLDNHNPVFCVFMLWSSLLIIKFICMSFLTVLHRYRTKTVANPEDGIIMGATEVGVNEEVERIRRAHHNDMENILPYLSIGLFYVLTDPNPMAATILIRVATVARFLHTIVYAVYVVPQPARAICFFIHVFIMLYMAVMVVIYFI